MASPPPSFAAHGRPRPRRWRRLLLGGVLALVLLAAWFWTPITASSRAGAAYGARIGCACRYIAGRDIGQCRGDLEAGMRFVMLSADDEAKSVTARVPLLARETATFHAGQGCLLENWKD